MSPKSSVRVVWVSSASAESMVPVKDSVDMDNLDYKDIFYPFKQGVTVVRRVITTMQSSMRVGTGKAALLAS